jgi:hypothetical protein
MLGAVGEDMKNLGLRSLAVAALAAIVGSAAAQTSLTGIVWYTTNSVKHYTGGYANTYGGDTYSRNLYVSENQAVGSGPLVNSANMKTLPTRVQIDITTPGTYTFEMYCNDESTGVTPYWGLNLFFNNDDLNPGISAWNTVNTPGFQSVDPIGTPTLDPLSMGLVQSTPSGGGGLRYTTVGGGTRIDLTAYSTWSTTHYNVDRVDNFSDVGGFGNGTKDQVIEFTLQVTPVPEPCSFLILGGTSLAMILRRRAKAARS